MDTLRTDLRIAVRHLLGARGFTSAAVVVLALAIGTAVAMFAVVDAVLLERTPVAALARLVLVWETDRHTGTRREPASLPDYLDIERQARTLDAVTAFLPAEFNLSAGGGEPVRATGLRVSRSWFSTLGVTPVEGRAFTPAEDVAGGPAVALISETLWERAFQRAPDIVGRTLGLDDRSFTIVGVVGRDADFGLLQILARAAYARSFADRGTEVRVDVWTPLQPDVRAFPRDTHPLFVLGRLAPRATLASARDELTSIAAALERSFPSNRGRGTFVEPMDAVVRGPVRPALRALSVAVLLVLLVGCVNVAGLLVARAPGRAREVAVRSALGGGRLRLLRQFVVEQLLVAGAAGAAGVGLAFLALRGVAALAPADVPRLDAATIDARVASVAVALTAAVGVAFGLVPAWQAWRLDVVRGLRPTGIGRDSGNDGGRRLRTGLVIVEIALATMLVAGAGLLYRSFRTLVGVDTGFDSTGVVKAEYQLPSSRYPADFRRWPDFVEMHRFTDALLERAARVAGVESAAVAGNHPLDRGFTNSFSIRGREAEARDWPEISIRRVTPGYFRTVGLRIARGRGFTEGDTTGAPPVLLINHAAAARFFAGRDPLGAVVVFWGAARTIVGIVENERFQGLAGAAPIAAYTPLAQTPSATGAGVLMVRSSRDANSIAAEVRRAVRDVDPQLAVFGVEALDDTLARSIAGRRFATSLLVGLAVVALVVAAAGLHAVLAFSVARRTREIGLRMVLGADARGVRAAVMREALGHAIAGLAVGLAGSVLVSRLLRSLLFGVSTSDPATLAVVAFVVGTTAIVAAYVPARRATRVDPAVALRE